VKIAQFKSFTPDVIFSVRRHWEMGVGEGVKWGGRCELM